jgi:hypothetical protein
MARTKYTAEQKAEALATLKANGGNVQYTASLLRIPRKTLEAWSKGDGLKLEPIPDGMIEQKSDELADRLDHIASLLTKEMTNPEKIAKASLKDVGVTLGITIDKRNLLRHQPTSITAKHDLGLKAKYERAVDAFVKHSEQGGFPVDRAEAIDLLAINLSDIKEILGVQ